MSTSPNEQIMSALEHNLANLRQAIEQANSTVSAENYVVRTSSGLYFSGLVGSLCATDILRAARFNQADAELWAAKITDGSGNRGQSAPYLESLRLELHDDEQLLETVKSFVNQ